MNYDTEPPSWDPRAAAEAACARKKAHEHTPQEDPIGHEPVDWGDDRPWPILDRAARYGLAGDILSAIEEQTEADPVAILSTELVAYGNAIGPGSRALVGDDEHPGKLFAALVGSSASGGKGTSYGAVRPILRTADEEWLKAAYRTGFVSGEAFVANLSGRHAADGVPIEKRAFIIEPEFARLLAVNRRDGSTSSPIIRGAWDDGRLQLIRAKETLCVDGTHTSILAHITPEELREKLSSVDVANGFANRFLFLCVRRARRLPSGGYIEPAIIGSLGKRLRLAMEHGRIARILHRTKRAEEIWAEFYLAEPEPAGLLGTLTARANAQKLRLSVLYALLDCRNEIDVEHVIAAEALWRYCADSVEHIFGGLTGSATQDRILAAARDAYPGGLDGTEVRDLFGRKKGENEITPARISLAERGLIRVERDNTTGGRARTLLFAVPGDQRRQKERDALFGRLSSLRSPAQDDTQVFE